MSTSSLDDVDTVSGDGDQMVIKTQPELPKYAQQPMPIGEKINLKFEVSCGRPLIYEWLKQGLREDVTSSSSSAASSRSALTPVSNGRELVGEVVEGGEGITSWQYICRAFCPSTGESDSKYRMQYDVPPLLIIYWLLAVKRVCLICIFTFYCNKFNLSQAL